MSKFYVGQRVRILWSVGWPELNGTIGVIFASASHGKCPEGLPLSFVGEWLVIPNIWPDGHHPAQRSHSGGKCWFTPDSEQLAPAYDGNEKVSWESMKDLWQPNPEIVRA